MPSIPVYQRQGQLTTEAPSVGKSPEIAGAPWRAVNEIGQTVTNAADAFRKANQVVEHTKATAEATKRIYDLRIKYENDTDYKTMGTRYASEMQKIKDDVLKGVYDPQVKGLLNMELDNNFASENVKIARVAKERAIDDGRANLITATDNTIDLYSTETNPAIKAGLKQKTFALYHQAAAAGLISREDEAKARATLLESFDKTDAKDEAYQSPMTFLENVKNGVYKHLNPDDKITLVKAAKSSWFLTDLNSDPAQTEKNLIGNIYGFSIAEKETAQKVYNQEVQAIQKNNEDALTTMIVNGQDVPDELVRDKVNRKLISPKFGETILKKEPLVAARAIDEKILRFNSLVERSSSITEKRVGNLFGIIKPSFKDLSELRADILLAAKDGYITESESKTLLKLTSDSFNAHKPFDNAVSTLASHSKMYANSKAQAEVKASMYSQLFDMIQEGKDPNVAVAEIIKRQIQQEVTEAVKTVDVPRIVVKRRTDGQLVKIPKNKFDPEIYIKI